MSFGLLMQGKRVKLALEFFKAVAMPLALDLGSFWSQLQQWTARSQSFLSRGIQAIKATNEAIAHQLQAALSDPIQQWLQVHWPLAWAIQHPLIAGLMIIVVVVLAINAIQFLLSPKTWLMILGWPVRWLARRLSPPTQKLFQLPPGRLFSNRSSSSLNLSDLTPDAQVKAILCRLDELSQEQTVLQQQLKGLLQNQDSD